jgi:hypothetical protein
MFPNAQGWRVCLAVLLGVSAAFALRAEGAADEFAGRARRIYEQALKDFKGDTNSTAAALDLARASFDWNEFSTNNAQRAEIARAGIAACKRLIAGKPETAAGQYYLAMNLGKLAQAEAPSLVAYRMVYEVEAAFVNATRLDVHYDYGGPARNLGQLYFQAPGWPLSVGSKRKARQWLELAVQLEPGYPENQLKLAEARLKWHETELFQASLTNIASIWPAARTNFAGQAWAHRWPDWEARRASLEKDFQKIAVRSPE